LEDELKLPGAGLKDGVGFFILRVDESRGKKIPQDSG
jgi:hypothetical protein